MFTNSWRCLPMCGNVLEQITTFKITQAYRANLEAWRALKLHKFWPKKWLFRASKFAQTTSTKIAKALRVSNYSDRYALILLPSFESKKISEIIAQLWEQQISEVMIPTILTTTYFGPEQFWMPWGFGSVLECSPMCGDVHQCLAIFYYNVFMTSKIKL